MSEGKDTKQEEVEETIEEKVEVEDVNEEAKEVTAEVEEETVSENKDKTKIIINIVTIVLIVVTLALGVILIVKKPSPKYAAKDYFNLSVKNPAEAAVKYGISEFDIEVEKEKGKYTTYKIDNIGEIEKVDGKEVVKVYYTQKGPNSYKISEEVVETLEKKEITKDSGKYYKEYLKELKLVLNERKDQLEEVENVLILIRKEGERNWTINSNPF